MQPIDSTDVVRSSWPARALDRLCRVTEAAWHDSFVGAAVRAASASARRRTPAGRARVAGVIVTAAALTALVLQQFAARPTPLIWMAPSTLLVFGIVLIAISGERARR